MIQSKREHTIDFKAQKNSNHINPVVNMTLIGIKFGCMPIHRVGIYCEVGLMRADPHMKLTDASSLYENCFHTQTGHKLQICKAFVGPTWIHVNHMVSIDGATQMHTS